MTHTIKPDTLTQHFIDLSLRPSKRLASVTKAEGAVAKFLFDQARAGFQGLSGWLVSTFGELYRDFEGPFQGEMREWANAIGISVDEMALVNCAYELDHLQHSWSIIEIMENLVDSFFCTAGVCFVEGHGMVHVRNLDWPINGMGEATRLFRFRKGEHQFVSVGFPGFVGVLSGMVPGGYSATINWAPPGAMPDFNYAPVFLLRKTLEECATYEEAVARLRRTRLSTSVFFTVCGTEVGQGCVIERTQDEAVVRPLKDGVVAQANHHVEPRFKSNNVKLQDYVKEGDKLAKTTEQRLEQMEASLRGFTGTPHSLTDLFSILHDDPVNNEETVQRMIFCPAKGELHVARIPRTEHFPHCSHDGNRLPTPLRRD